MGYRTISARHLFRVNNWGANPSTTPGTSVVPGASNAEGSWTQVLSALAQEIQGFWLRVANGFTTGNAKNQLLDVGIDPAGGSSYTAIISNLVCGASGDILVAAAGHRLFFPLRIPAGASVAVRIQGSNATAGTVRVGIVGYGQRSNAWSLPVGQISETIGTITNSSGVAFTPGNAADGTYVSLGTTTRALWWWQLGVQVDDGTMGATHTYIDLAVGDGSNKTVINRSWLSTTAAEAIGDPMNTGLLWHACYCPLPVGAELWVRGRCSGAPDSGYNAVAVGVGG